MLCELSLSRAITVPPVSYAVPAGCATAAALIALTLCLLCHRKLKRRAQEVHIDDLQQRVDDMHYCYRHHSLLHRASSTYNHGQTHNYPDPYHLEQPSPPSGGEIEHVCGEETSSPDSP